ncbi:hypothetical protein GCM10010435_21470 [Winogradskya consettensis]|uniref:Uncharacterized protein n=1 Tax=Winogradskya consettensis TaxID=113560 RepID=A0A919S789_9ACTN|nr:hypothetical protein [Actinoplanes consettensis]GIM66742.1 hypothetical protein Aco04nite_03240 [Actinoplanes consettensis]
MRKWLSAWVLIGGLALPVPATGGLLPDGRAVVTEGVPAMPPGGTPIKPHSERTFSPSRPVAGEDPDY